MGRTLDLTRETLPLPLAERRELDQELLVVRCYREISSLPRDGLVDDAMTPRSCLNEQCLFFMRLASYISFYSLCPQILHILDTL